MNEKIEERLDTLINESYQLHLFSHRKKENQSENDYEKKEKKKKKKIRSLRDVRNTMRTRKGKGLVSI